MIQFGFKLLNKTCGIYEPIRYKTIFSYEMIAPEEDMVMPAIEPPLYLCAKGYHVCPSLRSGIEWEEFAGRYYNHPGWYPVAWVVKYDTKGMIASWMEDGYWETRPKPKLCVRQYTFVEEVGNLTEPKGFANYDHRFHKPVEERVLDQYKIPVKVTRTSDLTKYWEKHGSQ